MPHLHHLHPLAGPAKPQRDSPSLPLNPPPQSVPLFCDESQVNGGTVVQISQMWLSDWMAELSRQLPPAHFTQVGVESVDSVKHAGSYHLRTSHR